MIKVEVLFPEIANLYGDLQNIEYLKRSSGGEIEVIEDNLIDEPYFVHEKPDLIYMGTLTEKSQILALGKLRGYTERLIELIEEGVPFLLTGNAMEIFGKEISDKEGSSVRCLEIFPIETKRDMMNRFNSLYLGKFTTEDAQGNTEGEVTIVGYKSQFTHSYWVDEDAVFPKECGYLFNTEKGIGLNPEIGQEGIRYKNFMATYLIGPLLILNPPFTKWLLGFLGIENPTTEFEAEAMEAYDARVKEYSEPDRGFYY